jgi:NADPH:quinone reductase-like Zn-dependent oxidoreductase
MRLATGLLRPKSGIPGYDLMGRVEAVGAEVSRFHPGDDVFGITQGGSCAEYAVTDEALLAHAPKQLTAQQAAAIPTSALAALHGLRDVCGIQAGQRVLINGAAGGIGTFAVQLAKHFGAEVTGVCSTANVELVRSLGADHVIDYTREDFTQRAGAYDIIFDNVENRSLSECRRAVKKNGVLVLNSGTGERGLEMMVRLAKPFLVSPFVSQKLCRYLSKPNHTDLTLLKDLVEAGKLHPVVDRVYPLSEVPAALLHVESGHARGKVVIDV